MVEEREQSSIETVSTFACNKGRANVSKSASEEDLAVSRLRPTGKGVSRLAMPPYPSRNDGGHSDPSPVHVALHPGRTAYATVGAGTACNRWCDHPIGASIGSQ